MYPPPLLPPACRPTLEIVGMGGGFQGEGIKTVIPRVAKAKLAARLAPDQRPDEVAQQIEVGGEGGLACSCPASSSGPRDGRRGALAACAASTRPPPPPAPHRRRTTWPCTTPPP